MIKKVLGILVILCAVLPSFLVSMPIEATDANANRGTITAG